LKTREELARSVTARESNEQESQGRVSDLGITTSQLDCLYQISKRIERHDKCIEDMLKDIVGMLPQGLEHPESTCARITYRETEFETDNFGPSQWSLSEDICVNNERIGSIEVFNTGEVNGEVSPFSGAEEKLFEVIASQVCDVVERDDALKSLKARLDFFQRLIDTVPNPIYYKDSQGRYQGFNLAFELFTGWSREELLGRTIFDVAPKEVAEEHHAVDLEIMRDGGAQTMEALTKSPDRKEIISVISRAAYLDHNGKPAGIVGVVIDFTEQRRSERNLMEINKRLEEMNQRVKENQNQLVQSEKMASIGQLAAGVAHEINNPVGFVKSNLGTLTGYVKTFKLLLSEYDVLTEAVRKNNTERQKAALDMVEKIKIEENLEYILQDIDSLLSESIDGTERVGDIVQNLKTFARLDETKIREADINEGIEATLKIVWNELKYKCTVNKNLNPLPRIRCNLGQLNQVFMNILVNAAQSIPEKGEITITTEATDEEIVIKVSDTGSGIPDEIKGRLFEPFFTTKPSGKGTGLGLSVSLDIVHKHNGVIEIESEMGVGTTFTIRLPIGGVDDEG